MGTLFLLCPTSPLPTTPVSWEKMRGLGSGDLRNSAQHLGVGPDPLFGLPPVNDLNHDSPLHSAYSPLCIVSPASPYSPSSTPYPFTSLIPARSQVQEALGAPPALPGSPHLPHPVVAMGLGRAWQLRLRLSEPLLGSGVNARPPARPAT